MNRTVFQSSPPVKLAVQSVPTSRKSLELTVKTWQIMDVILCPIYLILYSDDVSFLFCIQQWERAIYPDFISFLYRNVDCISNRVRRCQLSARTMNHRIR